MQNCVSSIFQAPINYINDLRYMKSNSLLMKGSSFYPSFIVSVIFGLLAVFGFAAYLIYYFIVNDQHQCYSNVSVGIIILACLYPVESIIIFICLVGSAGTSSTKCWKFVIILFFGLLLTGLGFGGLGIVGLCILNSEYDIALNLSFVTNQSFIEATVYCYLGFLLLYLILVPLLTYSYQSRNRTNMADNSGKNTCCDTLCCAFYYFFQFIFFLSILFVLFLKIMGPIILVYDLVEVGRAHIANSSSQTAFYALSVISIFGPITLFTIIYILTCCCCGNSIEEVDSNQTQMTETQRNEVFLTNKEGKNFEDNQYVIGNKQL